MRHGEEESGASGLDLGRDRNRAWILGPTKRRAFICSKMARLPAKKVGGRWVVSREALQKLFEIP